MTTVKQLVEEGRQRLARSPAIDHWPASRDRWEAETLLAHALGSDEPDALEPSETVPARARERFGKYVRRRAGGEPIPHILGYLEFRGLRIHIKPGAFVPRQSSEFLVEQTVKRLRRRSRPVHVDLATGMGPVALAVANEIRRARVHGTDLLDTGLRQARANAKRLRLRNVSFHRGDLFAPIPKALRGAVDVFTIHPPYVPKDEVGDLPLEVKGFEPETVLTDFSPHGLGLVERTAEEGWDWLQPGGWVLIEVSPDRTRDVKRLLTGRGYREVRSTDGWPNVTRVVTAQRP